MLATIPIRPAAPPAAAVPVASAADIRAAIDVLTEEADANDAIGGSRAMAHADSYRRVVTLLRANLYRAGR